MSFMMIHETTSFEDLLVIRAENAIRRHGHCDHFLHCALASGAVYCNRSCLCVCVFVAGRRCPNLTTASARACSFSVVGLCGRGCSHALVLLAVQLTQLNTIIIFLALLRRVPSHILYL